MFFVIHLSHLNYIYISYILAVFFETLQPYENMETQPESTHVNEAIPNDELPSNEAIPTKDVPNKTKYGVVSNDMGYSIIYLKFVDTIEEAKELLLEICEGFGEPESASDYWAQYDYGQHGETVSIIENPGKLIEELDNCSDCERIIEESTDSKLHYYIEDCGEESGEVWGRYIMKFMRM